MNARRYTLMAALTAVVLVIPAAHAQQPFGQVAEEVNKKMVKLFGSGGFRGLASYGTGILVSPDGHILTVASHLLDTQDLRVHLYDGRRFHAKVLVIEPDLDAALVKIDKVEELPHFDLAQIAKRPVARNGDWVLGFSNQFQIATRDEPVSVQRGVVAAYTKLHGRRGIFEAPYRGDVYVIDAITNNPGAGGGALTTRRGELLGIIGKELRNTLTDTWMNYAIPIQAHVDFVEKAMQGKYIPKEKPKVVAGGAIYHGIILVPNVVERTPAFVEDVIPGSPAAKAGLRPDDLIVYVDGEQVGSIKIFREYMEKARPGDKIKLEVRRTDKGSTGKIIPFEILLEEPVAKVPPKK